MRTISLLTVVVLVLSGCGPSRVEREVLSGVLVPVPVLPAEQQTVTLGGAAGVPSLSVQLSPAGWLVATGMRPPGETLASVDYRAELLLVEQEMQRLSTRLDSLTWDLGAIRAMREEFQHLDGALARLRLLARRGTAAGQPAVIYQSVQGSR